MNNDYYGNDDEINEEDEIDPRYKVDELHATKKNMPVKTHMRKLEDILAELKRNLNDNRKSSEILRSEHQSLEHKTKEKCNEIVKLIMDDLNNFDKDLRRIMQNDKTETDFFKTQVNCIMQDKIKLQQNGISLESKLKVCENDVGVDYQ